ncbi:hypothetical protein B0H14DRAFT_363698 [Mycena olivaceomarginata]|nr:hypothetical protein B0H14DRAFT_363698 [Mycena olivaceomarginata]
MTAGARGARLHQPDRHPFSVHVLASSLRRQVGRVPVYRACGKHRPLARTIPPSLRRQGPPQARPVLSTPTSQTQGAPHRSPPPPPSPTSTSLLPIRNPASPPWGSYMPPAPFASPCSPSPSTVHRPRVGSRRRGVRGSARRPGSQTPSRRERSQSAGSTSGHGAHPTPSAAILRAPPTCRRRARTTHKRLLPFVDNHSPWRLGWG